MRSSSATRFPACCEKHGVTLVKVLSAACVMLPHADIFIARSFRRLFSSPHLRRLYGRTKDDTAGTSACRRVVRSSGDAGRQQARPAGRSADRRRPSERAACALCAGADGVGPGRSAAQRRRPHSRTRRRRAPASASSGWFSRQYARDISGRRAEAAARCLRSAGRDAPLGNRARAGTAGAARRHPAAARFSAPRRHPPRA